MHTLKKGRRRSPSVGARGRSQGEGACQKAGPSRVGVVKRIVSIEGVGREDQDAVQKRCGQPDNFSEVGLSKEGWAPSSHLGYGQVGTRSLGWGVAI